MKGLLRDQSVLAGVGNAYSDEVLHVAKISPFAVSAKLDEEQVGRLYDALRGTLRDAIAASVGKPAKELKDAKRGRMRVHGRTGQTCPECGDVVREVSSPTARCSTARPARPAARCSPTGGCPSCSSSPPRSVAGGPLITVDR